MWYTMLVWRTNVIWRTINVMELLITKSTVNLNNYIDCIFIISRSIIYFLENTAAKVCTPLEIKWHKEGWSGINANKALYLIVGKI